MAHKDRAKKEKPQKNWPEKKQSQQNSPINGEQKSIWQRQAPLGLTTILLAGGLALAAWLQSVEQTSAQQQRSPQHQAYCLELESALARSMHSTETREARAKLLEDKRNLDRIFHRLKREADRRKCYAYYLFSKELRRSPRCIRLDKKIRSARRSLSAIHHQLNRTENAKSSKRHRQDKIIRALARNKCGRHYEREARKRNGFGNWFSNGFFAPPQNRYDQRHDQFQFATHRTLCVRLCDGYYFPISFATTSNRFSQDQDMCQSRCAAPARLFTHPNPGGTAEQMNSVDGISYESLANAWRFKKEYVKGCSCKVTEYNPSLLKAKPAGETEEKSESKTEDIIESHNKQNKAEKSLQKAELR